jgi:hypothetical protein
MGPMCELWALSMGPKPIVGPKSGPKTRPTRMVGPGRAWAFMGPEDV